MTRTTAVHCAKHGLVHVEECPSCLMSRLRAELAEQRREWAEARLEADDLRAGRDALAGALLTRSGELEETRAEVARLNKMLDVCSAVHEHNVKLKATLEETRASGRKYLDELREELKAARKALRFVLENSGDPTMESAAAEGLAKVTP